MNTLMLLTYLKDKSEAEYFQEKFEEQQRKLRKN